MRFSLSLIMTGITLVLPSIAHCATPEVIWCHNCTSTQVETAVLTDPIGIGTLIYIGDTVTRSVKAYEVYVSVDHSQHPPKRVREVLDAPADSALVTKIAGAIDFYNFAPVGWQKQIEVQYTGPDPTASAFTTANSGAAQNNFNTWINSTYSGSHGLTVIYGDAVSVFAAAHVIDATTAPHLTITTTFDDGSKISSN